MSSNKQNVASPAATQTIPDKRNLSLENYDTEAVNHDGEEAEMIEFCSGDTKAVNTEALNSDEEEAEMEKNYEVSLACTTNQRVFCPEYPG
ncbi:hypothetical protein OIU77_015815 [Salix suchowensis]|uniref:Uncharacterized protein n=1 Tax=Salix suchowensis TaxID=1278906 RepID=A0ABQ8ZIH6_9ROSI|nr:hypothetical protein OIU77_015815 [Salix suchowensis]